MLYRSGIGLPSCPDCHIRNYVSPSLSDYRVPCRCTGVGRGVYFAFRDEGACATLLSVRVYYVTCALCTSGFVYDVTYFNVGAEADVSDYRFVWPINVKTV